MRVLMLSWEFPPRAVGGLSRHVFELSRALVAGGCEVEVITCGGDNLAEREIMEGVGVWRVNPYPGSGERGFIDWVQRLNFALLEKGVAVTNSIGRVDLIHAHDWLVTYAARGLKYIYTTPLLATIHATEHGRNNGLHTAEQHQINDVEWWLTYEAWKVICCSRYMREELHQIFRLPLDKLIVIPNGIRSEVAVTAEEEVTLPEGLDDPETRLIFYVGRLVREKGVQVILEAAPMILNRYPQARFVIAGTGPFADQLKQLSREMGLAEKVYFVGYINERTKNELYRNAAVSVFPSLYEPFGIVALEAMVMGSPLVVSSCGGLDEIIDHEVEGLKIFPGNAASLAEQVCRLLDDEEWAATLAERAYRKVRQQYSWEKVAQKTAEVYSEIVLSPENKNWRQSAAAGIEVRREKINVEQREEVKATPFFV